MEEQDGCLAMVAKDAVVFFSLTLILLNLNLLKWYRSVGLKQKNFSNSFVACAMEPD